MTYAKGGSFRGSGGNESKAAPTTLVICACRWTHWCCAVLVTLRNSESELSSSSRSRCLCVRGIYVQDIFVQSVCVRGVAVGPGQRSDTGQPGVAWGTSRERISGGKAEEGQATRKDRQRGRTSNEEGQATRKDRQRGRTAIRRNRWNMILAGKNEGRERKS